MDVPVTPVPQSDLSGQSNGAVSTNITSQKKPPVALTPFVPWIVSGFVYIVLFLCILIVLPMDSWFAWKRVVAQYVTRSEYVVVGAGLMGDGYFDLTIKKAYLKRSGWLVVTAVSHEYDLRCMQVYGKSELLPAGRVSNATIRLPNITPDTLDETTNQPPLAAGTEVAVGIIYDDGTGSFETPILLRDKTGALIFGKTKLGYSK